MDKNRLEELRKEVTRHRAFIDDHAMNTSTEDDVLELIDAELARQSVKSEDVAEAIDMLQVIRPSENEIKSGEYPDVADAIDLAITALQAYRPTTRKDRIVEEVDISKTETTSCEWCEGQQGKFFDVNWYDYAEHKRGEVRYCPNCGRKLVK